MLRSFKHLFAARTVHVLRKALTTLWNKRHKRTSLFLTQEQTIGAVTHTTVNGISRGKFTRGTSQLGFSFPWFQRLHANSDFPRQNKCHAKLVFVCRAEGS